MAKQTVDIGTYANDGTGDSLRTAFDKINDNFTELYDGAGGGNTAALPTWLTTLTTAHLPTLNTDYGWDSNGVWFTNATITGNTEGVSYPVRLTNSIPASQGVVITVEFDANTIGNDFGIGVWETGTNPVWEWGEGGGSGGNRIGAQYNGSEPELYGITGAGVTNSGYNLPFPGSYKARLTISPPSDGDITVTLQTLNLSNTVLNTITYTEQAFTTAYTIGFAADQDNGTSRTYMKNLTVNINNGATIRTDTLTSYNSGGTTENIIGNFSFDGDEVSISEDDMNIRTFRAGFDGDADVDILAADDVFINAEGDSVGIDAANVVTITTCNSNMHPTVFDGDEEDFAGEWDGTTLSLIVPNSETTLITLLNHYVGTTHPIWIRTASGYVETETTAVATKTVVGSETNYEIPVAATSPTANVDIISMMVYDSINGANSHTWQFTKNGALLFPSAGKIEPVGMGWTGLTNGTSGNPVSVIAKNNAGDERAGFSVYNNGGFGDANIFTVNAPGIPTAVDTIATTSGSWNTNPLSDLATTGGSGSGLIVDVTQTSGSATTIAISTPGSGYVQGETITVTRGSSNATFTISVSSEQFHTWAFDEDGVTTLPEGSTISETSTTLILTPPTALAGQGLVIRTTVGGGLSTIDTFTPGSPVTVTFTDNGSHLSTGGYVDDSESNTWAYTITGISEADLGSPLTGSFLAEDWNINQNVITFNIPAESEGTGFTITLDKIITEPPYYLEGIGGINPDGRIALTVGTAGVDPEISHVHLTTADPTTVDLYLGDDDQYVKIEKNGGDVVVGTNTNTNHWIFGDDATLTLPEVPWNYEARTFVGVDVYGEATLTFTVLPNNTISNAKVEVGAGGYGENTQMLTVLGTVFPGGTSPANDIVFEVETFPVLDFPSEITTASTVTYISGTPPTRYDHIVSPDSIGFSADGSKWTFGYDGTTTLPGAIKGEVIANNYIDTTINLDVTATINKLVPTDGGYGSQYHLVDGIEGQIMYIALATGGETANEYTSMSFDHARYTNGNGFITEDTNRNWWLPFAGGASTSGSTILTLVFIDGHWNLPHNWFD